MDRLWPCRDEWEGYSREWELPKQRQRRKAWDKWAKHEVVSGVVWLQGKVESRQEKYQGNVERAAGAGSARALNPLEIMVASANLLFYLKQKIWYKTRIWNKNVISEFCTLSANLTTQIWTISLSELSENYFLPKMDKAVDKYRVNKSQPALLLFNNAIGRMLCVVLMPEELCFAADRRDRF